MYFLLKMMIFQPAMLVYQRVVFWGTSGGNLEVAWNVKTLQTNSPRFAAWNVFPTKSGKIHVNSTCSIFTPLLGEMIQFDKHIFQTC